MDIEALNTFAAILHLVINVVLEQRGAKSNFTISYVLKFICKNMI